MALWDHIPREEVDMQLDSFRAGAYHLVKSMYELTPMQKGQLTPYIRIWKPGTDTITPVDNYYLSNDFYEPPKFGQMKDSRFGERPEASIENVVVKTINPRGWKLYRELDINITVHKPNAVFGVDENDKSAVRDILNFKNDLMLEYGWKGPAGIPIVDGASVTWPVSIGQQSSPARRLIRFKTVNYNFQLTADGQVKFQIHAIENGEVASRNITIFDNEEFKISQSEKMDIAKFTNAVDKLATKLDTPVAGEGRSGLVNGEYLSIKTIFNTLFAQPLTKLAVESGYTNVKLQFGYFNDKCPSTTPAYGEFNYASVSDARSVNTGQAYSIGDFLIRKTDVKNIVGNSFNGQPMSIDAMMRQFIAVINDQSVWSDNKDTKYSVPTVMLRTVFDPKPVGTDQRPIMLYQLVDRKRYLKLKGIDAYDGDLHTHKKSIKDRLEEFLAENNIPKLELYHQGSFVQSANFSVVNDDQMKSAFILRQQQRKGGKLVGADTRITTNAAEASQIAMLYRSAIRGDVTMLGNFCFEILGTVWMQFGIWAYDGLFYVLQKTDTIGSDGFTTQLSLIAEGSDPIGVGDKAPLNTNDLLYNNPFYGNSVSDFGPVRIPGSPT